MSITRRTAITTLAAAGAGVLLPGSAQARPHRVAGADAVGLLYDPVRCIGCKECVRACAAANGKDADASCVPGAQLSTRSLTVLRQYESPEKDSFLKVQCMHCVDPACVSACMLGAMQKREDGAVTWNGDLCVGCRYCQIACPFNVPRFEWETALPELTKCQLCSDRRAEGQLPACADTCKMGALVYGRREDLLLEAHRRITRDPEKYEPTVYGEHEGGGTSVLYLARRGVSFQTMGLPPLSPESVPAMPETIQHTLYRGFAAPLALLGVFGITVRRNARKLHEEEAKAHEHEHSEPVGGKLFTIPFTILALLAAIGFGMVGWRFLAGLGATTNLNDGYPMGLWIAFDVVTGTALACGGYAVAILVYLLNRGRYHPLVRAAIVTSALGYTLGGLSVLIDIGRAWNFYKIPLFFTEWNFNSILLEVALCIMFYTMVLWIELSPALLEGWKDSRLPALRRFAVASLPRIEKAMPYVIAVGLLLPTMHQSSLGSLMLLAGAKLHPIWRTPLLPLLFLVSCIGMGYAAVVLEATISSKVFKRPSETPMLRALGGPISFVLLFYATLRAIDIVQRGQLPAVLAFDHYAFLFHIEMILLTVPAFMLLFFRRRANAPMLATIGVMVILGGALYRFSTYLIAFNPGAQWSYFPSIPEFAVTIGLVAAELMGYVFLVKRFPILRGAPSAKHEDGAHGPEVRTTQSTPHPTSAIPKHGAVAGAMVALALLAGPRTLEAQKSAALHASGSRAAIAQQKEPDRRCLTAAQCLTEEVPLTEPHKAVCATCHNLAKQKTTREAARTCASAGCHERPDTLTPFHRGLHANVQQDCISCHPAHNARIRAGGDDCHVCHDSGGQLPSDHLAKNVATRTIRPGLVFRHPDHTKVECRSCHSTTGKVHGSPMVLRVEQCRSCHHREPVADNCLACHDPKTIAGISVPVTRKLDIRVGTLDQPTRTLPFEHSRHVDNAQCRSCHDTGLELSAAKAECNGCHAEHKTPTANCSTCHEAPKPGAHPDRNVHLGCGGAGCHDHASATILAVPRTRQACLSCHVDMQDHQPASQCADCHKLPKPRTTQR